MNNDEACSHKDDEIECRTTKFNKPVDVLQEIRHEIEAIGEAFITNKGERIPFREDNDTSCFTFITSGHFSVYRKYDHLLMHSSSAPSLFGMVEFYQPRNAHYVLAETECSCIKVNAELACESFTKNGSWEKICQIQVYFIQVLQTRDFQLVGVNAYLIIKNKLLELLQEPEDFRIKQSVLLYIQLRSKLSKSLISKILSALRVGGYIDMKKGKLIAVNHLPKDY